MENIPLANGIQDALLDEFVFDAWMLLAQQNPLAFERARRELFQLCIDQACDCPSAFQLQCELDMIRIQSQSPYRVAREFANACASLRTSLEGVAVEAERCVTHLRRQ